MKTSDQLPLETEVVRRSNTTIGISPRTGAGNLTVLVRRIFNVLVHFTMKDGDREVYQRPLREVMRYIDYNSNDLDRIKTHLETMASTPMVWDTSTDDDEIWSTAALVAHASIIRPKKKGLASHLEWSFAKPIRQKLLAPKKWTQLSLVMHTKLKSGASIALFEICARYETFPGQRTMRQPYEWWYPVLTGTREDVVPEYKYFKRDVLRPAIAEVNMHADFMVELIEHRRGNKVAELQFAVRSKPTEAIIDADAPRFDGELLERVIRLGMSQADARAICEKHDPPLIQAAIDYTEKRAAKQPALDSTAAYFKTALKKGYKEPAKAVRPHQQAALDLPDPEAEKGRLRAAYDANQRDQALAYWQELNSEPAQELITEFLATEPPRVIARAIKKDRLESMSARTAFTEWLAAKLWTEPTTDDLLKFALKDGYSDAAAGYTARTGRTA
jgi:plasmid replication initiation protein